MASKINKQPNAERIAEAIAGVLTDEQWELLDIAMQTTKTSSAKYAGIKIPARLIDVSLAMRDIGLVARGYKDDALVKPTTFGRAVYQFMPRM